MKSYIVAPIVTAVSIPIGVVLSIPSVMCWDAGENTKPYMKLLGFSGLSIIPIAVVSCAASLATGRNAPLAFNVIPYTGIALAMTIGAFEEKKEHEEQGEVTQDLEQDLESVQELAPLQPQYKQQ